MKHHHHQANGFSNGKHTSSNNFIQILSITLTLIFLTTIPLCFLKNSGTPLLSPEASNRDHDHIASTSSRSVDKSSEKKKKECDVFTGRWIPYPNGPYYTNKTCDLIIDQQNCMKFGRNDTEFMKWRWKPDQCELPVFDAVRFLEMVRGKSMAFVGDSVGRNQMQSLLCLLSTVAYPEDKSSDYTSDTTNFKRYFFKHYNFTLVTLWSPFLVKAKDADPNGHSMNSIMSLKLDEADEAWTSKVESFDSVIISAGQWFFRPLLYYENREIIGCHVCNEQNVTSFPTYYGYKMAFKTALKALQGLKNYKGVTFLRTYSPAHFENGDWNKGGSCVRTKPFTREEMKEKMELYNMEMYRTQVKALEEVEEEGNEKGLVFRLLATTEAMWMRPDGHPNMYGRLWSRKNVSSSSSSMMKMKMMNDCVHWCLPGPIDTWNEFLYYMLKKEEERLLM